MTIKVLMDSGSVKETISRIASEIIERNRGAKELGIIGVRTRGVHIAERIADNIEKLEKVRPDIGVLDIALYRDDLRKNTEWPEVKKSDISFQVEQRNVVLVDDVIYTGRTTRAAIEAIMDYGRPTRIELVAFIDRGHRELPIQPDYVGLEVKTNSSEQVVVRLKEVDGSDEVIVQSK